MQAFINPPSNTWPALCVRPQLELEFLESSVKNILTRVKQSGDEALREFTKQFDKADVKALQLTAQEIEQAVQSVPVELKSAIRTAVANIEKFHAAQQQTFTVRR